VSTTAITLPTAAAPTAAFSRNLRIYFREAHYDLLRMLRTRAFSLATLSFPVVLYIFFGLIMNRGEHIGNVSVAKYLLGSYACFGVIGAALFGIGVGLSGDLAAGWLELKRASPMPPVAYLLAKCTTAIAFGLGVTTLLTLMGIFFGHVTLSPLDYVRMLGLTAVGAIPFACMGLAIALLAPANSAPGITNMLYLPLSFCGGLWMPIMFLPKALQTFAKILPTYHLGQLMNATLGYPMIGSVLSHILGLLGFTFLMLGIAWIAFRRLEENS
jgi:ABC-2 type transport system permease protein